MTTPFLLCRRKAKQGYEQLLGSAGLKEELVIRAFPLSCHQAPKPDRTSCVSRRSSIVSESIQNLSKGVQIACEKQDLSLIAFANNADRLN